MKKSVTEKATYIIEPDFNSPFEYCNLSYETPYGEIKIQWNKKLENKKVKLNVLKYSNTIISYDNKYW